MYMQYYSICVKCGISNISNLFNLSISNEKNVLLKKSSTIIFIIQYEIKKF